jgi:hypothetical protein
MERTKWTPIKSCPVYEMRKNRFLYICLAICALFGGYPAKAYTRHVWQVTSPDHAQTFTYGSEQSRIWVTRGADRHLALLLNFTNDPYVDRSSPREYDNFIFNFPGITLGPDGHTYYYRASNGRSLPVAAKRSGFLGVDEIKLLPTSYLAIKKPHGYLTLTLMIRDRPFPADPDGL